MGLFESIVNVDKYIGFFIISVLTNNRNEYSRVEDRLRKRAFFLIAGISTFMLRLFKAKKYMGK